MWWPGWTLTGHKPFSDTLRVNYQRTPALIPAYTDLDAVAPEPVVSLKASHKGLSWKPVETDDVFQQPHFYVVYRFDADAPVDLSQSRNIVKITRDTHYKPAEKRNGRHQFVVTVVDKCWNESEPSIIVKW